MIKYRNAGAGSGKTYTLSHELSDSLTAKTGNVLPSQIILTTFTRAAAAEFRRKAREVLLSAGKPELAAELESSAIGTVHSVCEIFVRKYWYRLGLSPAMEILQEDDKNIYINQSIAALVAGRSSDVSFFNQFRRAFDVSKMENFIYVPDTEFWKNTLRNIIDRMTNYSIENVDESIKRSCAEVDAIFDGKELDVNPALAFLKAYDIYCDDPTKKNKVQQKKDNARIRRSIKTFPAFAELWTIFNPDTFETSDCKFIGRQRGYKDFCNSNPKFDADVFRHYLEAQITSRTFGEQIKTFIKKIFELAAAWREEYRRYKEQNHILDFSDLEQNFLRILEEPEFEDVRKEIGQTYKLVMVDEFQDSNPVQVRIFNALHAIIEAYGGEMVWVGDPKQSIYAFRGSDTEMIKRETGINKVERLEALKTSYRSRPALVNLANKVFLDPFKGMGLSEDEITLPVVKRSPDELPGHEAILHWNTEQGAPDIATKLRDILFERKWKVVRKKRDDENEKEYEKSKVVDINPRDIAILCRNGYDVTNVVSALRDAGIPVSATDLDMINWSECQLVQALLRYVADKHDSGAKADILHLLYGVSSEEILKDRQEYLKSFDEKTLEIQQEKDFWLDDDTRIARIADIAGRVENYSVSQIVSALILELDLYREVQRWDFPVARRQNLGIIQQVAMQYEQHCDQMKLSSNISGFIGYMHDLDSGLKNEDTTSNTVKVMTYHKSKGLEWNVVILYNLSDNMVKNDDKIMRSYFSVVNCPVEGTDGYYIHCVPTVKGSKKTWLPFFVKKVADKETFKKIRKRNIEEETRLLYVGVTRARDFLVTTSKNGAPLLWISDCGCGSGDVSTPGKYAYPWRPAGESECAALVCNLPEPLPEEAKKEGGELEKEAEPILPRKTYETKYIQPSKCQVKAEGVRLSEVFKGEKMDHKISEDDSDVCGTCIHNIFAAYDPGIGRDRNVEMASRIISGIDLSLQLINPDSIIRSIEQLYGYLNEKYPGGGETMHETPFLLKVDDSMSVRLGLQAGQIVRGEIDLIWLTGDKKCVLVDYKSYHGNPNFNTPDAEAQKHYSGYAPQLLAYKTALEADGYTVEDVLVYYHVQGRAIRFEF